MRQYLPEELVYKIARYLDFDDCKSLTLTEHCYGLNFWKNLILYIRPQTNFDIFPTLIQVQDFYQRIYKSGHIHIIHYDTPDTYYRFPQVTNVIQFSLWLPYIAFITNQGNLHVSICKEGKILLCKQIENFTNVKQVSCWEDRGACITEDGSLYEFNMEVNKENEITIFNLRQITEVSDIKYVEIHDTYTSLITAKGTVKCINHPVIHELVLHDEIVQITFTDYRYLGIITKKGYGYMCNGKEIIHLQNRLIQIQSRGLYTSYVTAKNELYAGLWYNNCVQGFLINKCVDVVQISQYSHLISYLDKNNTIYLYNMNNGKFSSVGQIAADLHGVFFIS